MSRRALRHAAAALALLWSAGAHAQTLGALGAPGEYSLVPAPPVSLLGTPTGEASLSYGSRNMEGASIAMQTGAIGDTGLRGFVALGAASGPAFPGYTNAPKARVTERGGTIGVQKSFADGMTISVAGGWANATGPAGVYGVP